MDGMSCEFPENIGRIGQFQVIKVVKIWWKYDTDDVFGNQGD